ELQMCWRPHYVPDMSAAARLRLEEHNRRVFNRHLKQHRPEVVTWWAMGGMSLSLVERVRRASVPAVAFVHDDWPDYARSMDGWMRAFAGRWRPLAGVAERVSRIPTRVDLDRAARYVFVSETTRRRVADAGIAPLEVG